MCDRVFFVYIKDKLFDHFVFFDTFDRFIYLIDQFLLIIALGLGDSIQVMMTAMLEPDDVSFNAAISSCEKGQSFEYLW